jgi:hypothetical protein
MVIVMVVNAVLAALVFAVVVGSLVRSISAEQRDHASLALRLRSPHRGQSAPFIQKDVLSA